MINIRTVSGQNARDVSSIAAYPREVPSNENAPALDNYMRADNSSGQAEAPSLWGGEAADALGLAGEVKAADQIAALKGFDPRTGQALLSSAGDARRYGWELVLSADLDVSALAAVSERDHDAITRCHDEAVQVALRNAERWISARSGHGGERQEPAKLLWSSYRHESARPPRGEADSRPDPQLHSHIFLHNAGLRADGTWSTLEAREMVVHQRAIDALYKAALAERLQRLGYQVERTQGNQMRVVGVPEGIHDEFGRRHRQIVAGMTNAAATGGAAAEAREAERQNSRADKAAIPASELRADWQARAEAAGLSPELAESLRVPGRTQEKPSLEAWREAVRDELFSHESVIGEKQIWETVASRAIGYMPAEQIAAEVEQTKADLIHLVAKQQQFEDEDQRPQRQQEAWTTKELYQIEREIVASADRRLQEKTATLDRETVDRAIQRFERERGFALSAEQQKFVRELSVEAGGIRIGQGRAGTGKSATMDAARIGYESGGYHVRGCALSGKAAAELAQSARIEDTSTIHALLHRLEPQTDPSTGQMQPARDRLTDRDVIVVDEAGMVDSRVMGRLLQHAEQSGARVIMIGDQRQLQSVGAGGVWRHLVEQAQARGPVPELTEVRRQRESWARDAGELVRSGRVAESLQQHADRGLLHVADSRESAHAETVARWLQHYDRQRPGDSLMIAGTRADVRALNDLAREEMRKRHQLCNEQQFRTTTREGAPADKIKLAEGDRIKFAKNARLHDPAGNEIAVRNGELATVIALDHDRRGDLTVIARRDDGQMVRFRERDYGQIAHGYAVTSHSSQGATVDHAVVLASGSLSREKTYVELTRARIDTNVVIPRREIDRLSDQVDVERRADPLEQLRSTVAAMGISRPKQNTLDYEPAEDAAEQKRQQAEQQHPEQQPQAPAAPLPAQQQPATDAQAQQQAEAQQTQAEQRKQQQQQQQQEQARKRAAVLTL